MSVTSIPSKTPFADLTLQRDDLSPEARKIIEALRDTWRADEEVVTRRAGAAKRLGCQPTHERDLERQGKVVAFLDGTVRLILVSSIYEHLIGKAIASYPLDQPPLKRPGVHMRTAAPPPAPKARPPRVPVRAAVAPPPAVKRARGRPRKVIPELTVVPAE